MGKNSLAHTQWECKCHIVFVPKFRRKDVYGKIRTHIAHILRNCAKGKE